MLTGGAALLAQQLSARPTQDLDFLTSRGGDVPVARDEFESAATLGSGVDGDPDP